MTITRRLFLKNSALGLALYGLDRLPLPEAGYYSAEDFAKVPKIDTHFHLDVPNNAFPDLALSMKFHLVSVNVDAGFPLKEQFEVVKTMKQRYPGQMDFLGTFPVDKFGQKSFIKDTIAYIDTNLQAGALGFKVWKNIGMVLKNDQGRFVMIDDPALAPIFSYLEKKGVPVMGHLGEPKNCWLPENEITLPADKRYYTRHPEYHMYKHPEAPTYEQQIMARRNLLNRHPRLKYVGTHLASLEWSVEEIALDLDRYPRMMVDVAARMDHLQYQSAQDKDRVRRFLIRYQDRVMYGSDTTIDHQNSESKATLDILLKKWKTDWAYLATDSLIIEKLKVGDKEMQVSGLKLPREVMDKIYRKNARQFFGIK
ncbi:hypothetical protein DYBT9275_03387 [Dyadobacter sp. CECT 9275]|uniref:Amidohydrolase-related domain-containing protein n=1 Tax=Dyadobacter helix TaxID=2822344 RepID=A0A916NCH6_9BACT|nr:amidohydrolase family protein [Dyadobacter sp. CECT 9275]CAG5004521.1 hypothetical protein DYBT9275_03387 [Dyadobacter sp. CECT 9275]